MTVVNQTPCGPSDLVVGDSPAKPRPAAHRLRLGLRIALLLILFTLGAEIAARIDDWARLDTPIWSSPDRNYDLVTRDEFGICGRPHGRFLRWQMNAAGFRGPEIEQRPAPNVVRIAVLGSSEAFGIYESAGKEVPAQLQTKLGPKYEVINAAIPGMTVRTMQVHWIDRVRRFEPAIVLLCPSPMFYLADAPPGSPPPALPSTAAAASSSTASSKASPTKQSGGGPSPWRSRMFFRLHQRFQLPEFVHRWMDARTIAAAIAAHPAGWEFESAPPDRLQQFTDDLRTLVDRIKADGARPVLLTHSLRTVHPQSPKDWDRLKSMRAGISCATERAISEFEQNSNDAIRQIAREENIPLIDADPVISGHDKLFSDHMHLTDVGADVLSDLAVRTIQHAL